MRATTVLPENYVAIGTFDLAHNLRAVVLLNVLGLILMGLFGGLFSAILFGLRPREALAGMVVTISGLDGILQAVVLLVGLYGLMIVLHEGIHGVLFWIFTRRRPRFAISWAYATAAAPEWYIPRSQYVLVGLGPLVILSLAGIVAFTFLPTGWLLPALLVMVINASGAVGDLWVVGWILSKPQTCLAQDRGDAVTLFLPQAEKSEPLSS